MGIRDALNDFSPAPRYFPVLTTPHRFTDTPLLRPASVRAAHAAPLLTVVEEDDESKPPHADDTKVVDAPKHTFKVDVAPSEAAALDSRDLARPTAARVPALVTVVEEDESAEAESEDEHDIVDELATIFKANLTLDESSIVDPRAATAVSEAGLARDAVKHDVAAEIQSIFKSKAPTPAPPILVAPRATRARLFQNNETVLGLFSWTGPIEPAAPPKPTPKRAVFDTPRHHSWNELGYEIKKLRHRVEPIEEVASEDDEIDDADVEDDAAVPHVPPNSPALVADEQQLPPPSSTPALAIVELAPAQLPFVSKLSPLAAPFVPRSAAAPAISTPVAPQPDPKPVEPPVAPVVATNESHETRPPTVSQVRRERRQRRAREDRVRHETPLERDLRILCETTPASTPIAVFGQAVNRDEVARRLSRNRPQQRAAPRPVETPLERDLRIIRETAPANAPVTVFGQPLTRDELDGRVPLPAHLGGGRVRERSQTRPAPVMSHRKMPNPLAVKAHVSYANFGIVDMLGSTHNSYSLPGKVVLTIPTMPRGGDGKARELRDLSLVLEGKSEYSDKEGRYTPYRIHKSTIQLVHTDYPLQIPACDPARPHEPTFEMVIEFDLRLPGWLPATHTSEKTATSYGALAQGTIAWADGDAGSIASASTSSSLTSTIAAALRARPRTSDGDTRLQQAPRPISAYKDIIVRRHRMPSALSPGAESRERTYKMTPDLGIASMLECVVTVPEWADIHGPVKSLRATMRVRARPQTPSRPQRPTADLDGAQEGLVRMDDDEEDEYREEAAATDATPASGADVVRLYLLELGMEVEETERVTSKPSSSFASWYPIPADQPRNGEPEHALLRPRLAPAPSSAAAPQDSSVHDERTRSCLLAPDGTQRNFLFAERGLAVTERWRRINIVLPIPTFAEESEALRGLSHCVRPQTEVDSPFLRIRHALKTRLVCCPVEDAPPVSIVLSTPIKFSTTPATAGPFGPGTSGAFSARTMAAVPMLPPLAPYVQLFHENGEPREEVDALPLYEQPAAPRLPEQPRSPAPAYTAFVLPPMTAASQRQASAATGSLATTVATSRGSPTPPPDDDRMDVDGDVEGYKVEPPASAVAQTPSALAGPSSGRRAVSGPAVAQHDANVTPRKPAHTSRSVSARH